VWITGSTQGGEQQRWESKMRRKVGDTDDELHEEEEKSNDSLRDSVRPSGKRGERVGRWDYMRPFSGSSFGLASEDWLRV
jgi:hypothetical protein